MLLQNMYIQEFLTVTFANTYELDCNEIKEWQLN